MNKNLTRYQQAQFVLKLKNIRNAHEYYLSNPGCTMKQAMTFTPLPYNIIKEYSAIRTECLTAINSVIDVRCGCMRQPSGNYTKDILPVV